MKLNLNYQQAVALFELYQNKILDDATPELEDKLVMLHMIAIYKKLRSKMEGVAIKGYSVSVTPAEALAYSRYFTWADLTGFDYERNFISRHIANIDQSLTANMYRFKQPLKPIGIAAATQHNRIN